MNTGNAIKIFDLGGLKLIGVVPEKQLTFCGLMLPKCKLCDVPVEISEHI